MKSALYHCHSTKFLINFWHLLDIFWTTFWWLSIQLANHRHLYLAFRNSNLAPRLRGIKQKNWKRNHIEVEGWINNLFILFYSPKPWSQVRILIYWNWPIKKTGIITRKSMQNLAIVPSLNGNGLKLALNNAFKTGRQFVRLGNNSCHTVIRIHL